MLSVLLPVGPPGGAVRELIHRAAAGVPEQKEVCGSQETQGDKGREMVVSDGVERPNLSGKRWQ